MLDRRRLMLTLGASGVALAGCASTAEAPPAPVAAPPEPVAPPPPAPPPPTAAERANGLYERIYQQGLKDSPIGMTSLGLDRTPEGAWAKSKLDDITVAGLEQQTARTKAFLAELRAIPRSELSGMDAVNYDTVAFAMETGVSGFDRFKYGARGFPQAYVLNQLNSALTNVPDFLNSQHRIDAAEDAEAYLSRVEAYAGWIDTETERGLADAAAGAAPPDFVIDRTLGLLRAARKVPAAQSSLVASVDGRTKAKGIAGDWGARATRLVEERVYPAYDRQIAALERLRKGATHDAGVWRLPDGEAYYAWGIRSFVTANMSGEEVHQLGLAQVAEISAAIDSILKSQGRTRGAVGRRLQALGKEKRFVYPNTESGKTQLLADLNAQMADMAKRLPNAFGTLPKASVEVKRVPAEIEAGAPGGYYQPPTLDGSRPGAYYINLRDTAEWPKWTLPTLTWHEAAPGHHFQIALQLEAQGIPMLRRVQNFSGYAEGWGLYAEQLADELGAYENDPFGRVGYLQSMLFRAVRLVVDSGLHHKRWSREQAIRYMVDTLGDQESSVTTEVERYCVWPGQAASYKVGQIKWLELRENAKARLGPKFDLRGFHDAGLLAGAMPLEVLERRIADWVATQS